MNKKVISVIVVLVVILAGGVLCYMAFFNDAPEIQQEIIEKNRIKEALEAEKAGKTEAPAEETEAPAEETEAPAEGAESAE